MITRIATQDLQEGDVVALNDELFQLKGTPQPKDHPARLEVGAEDTEGRHTWLTFPPNRELDAYRHQQDAAA